MIHLPSVKPIHPTPGEPWAIHRSPFWIGSDASSDVVLFHPQVLPRHVVLSEREDGFWASAPHGAQGATVDGAPLSQPTRLSHGSRITLAPGAELEFHSPPSQEPPVRDSHLSRATLPRVAERTATQPSHPPKRRMGAGTLKRFGTPAGIGLAALLVGAGIWFSARGFQPPPPAPLSEADAALFQELLSEAAVAMERGSTLLEVGLTDLALAEFAGALNSVETSRLGDNPWIQPRLALMESTIRDLYQAKRVDAPLAFSNRDSESEGSMDRLFKSDVSPSEFQERTADVFLRFEAEFGRSVVVTGHDHPEHLSLYGQGGALDLRVRDLSLEEVEWLADGLRAMGLRVKDFSTDAVLADQVRRAQAAGLLDRAGTGLHLHVDRFPSRSDRFTTTGR